MKCTSPEPPGFIGICDRSGVQVQRGGGTQLTWTVPAYPLTEVTSQVRNSVPRDLVGPYLFHLIDSQSSVKLAAGLGGGGGGGGGDGDGDGLGLGEGLAAGDGDGDGEGDGLGDAWAEGSV